MEKIITVSDVSKKFRINRVGTNTLKDTILRANQRTHEDFWALKNVSFEVEEGECFWVLGRNGCGKSTLLKMIAKIQNPTEGKITTRGHISSLLELGAGFYPEYTGLENIYMYGSIHGMRRKEIDKKVENIISFAELGEFINTPIRTYSSGMKARLAFSVSINVNQQILLIDEILAVGDASFRKKCYKKISDIKKCGTTVVIVSHNVGDLFPIVDRAMWIEKGENMGIGKADHMFKQYKNFTESINNG